MESDEQIRSILNERIDDRRERSGIVAGVIGPHGQRIVAHGALDTCGRTLDGDIIFEIGSVTKVFTSLLLADMVRRREVALSDPVSQYLPNGAKMPERRGRSIELQHLATHTSGLPRLPPNLHPKDRANPYADYSVAQLYDFLSHHSLKREIGSKYEYSNIGVGLLGHVLALHAGMDYESLVCGRISVPLGMNSTAIALSPDIQPRLVVGHGVRQQPVPYWDLPTLAGAGALRSSANDLLTFLAANLGLTESALTPSMRLMLSIRVPTGLPHRDVALGWHILTHFGNDIVWHNGGTGGFRCFAGFNPADRKAVVILSNSQVSVDDIGCHLLDARYPLALARQVRRGPLLAAIRGLY